MNPQTSDCSCHVLYIEDNPAEARLLVEALNNSGRKFQISVLKDGEEALAYFQAKKPRPDVIVLDVELPKIHGVDVLEAIKSDSELKMIPVLVFLDPPTPHFTRVNQLGIDLSLRKPLMLEGYDQVAAAIYKLYSNSRA